jgi:hypothetical protein
MGDDSHRPSSAQLPILAIHRPGRVAWGSHGSPCQPLHPTDRSPSLTCCAQRGGVCGDNAACPDGVRARKAGRGGGASVPAERARLRADSVRWGSVFTCAAQRPEKTHGALGAASRAPRATARPKGGLPDPTARRQARDVGLLVSLCAHCRPVRS